MRRSMQALLWLLMFVVMAQPARAGACDADLNHDGTVNTLDLGILLSSWTLPPARACAGSACLADLNGDGAVNTLDLGQLLVAWDADCSTPPAPRVVITPVAHSGDPAPGIPFPGAFLDFILTPQIDGEGNVLFKAFIGAPGLGEIGNQAIFYGPPGNVTKLFWETDPAPDFPTGVTIKDLFSAEPRLAEVGSVAFNAILQGPGITPGVNDTVIYAGDPRIPGSFHVVLRSHDQAPGCDPGVLIHTCPSCIGFGMFTVSDNGTLLIVGDLAGPGVTPANDRAIWTGMPGNLQLVWRSGMHAPGTPAGVTFTWADNLSINDSGQIGFRGMLAGPGIVDGVSDRGQWSGGPGSLQVVAWTGVPAPGLPPGSAFSIAFGGLTSINSFGDMHAHAFVEGPGITAVNDEVLYAGLPGRLLLVAREGDPVPEAGDDVSIDIFGSSFLNAERDIFSVVKLRGASITGLSVFAALLGPYHTPVVELLSGNPAPHLPSGTALAGVNFASSLAALNDVGDLVTVTKITGTSVRPETDVVLWLHQQAIHDWIPLLRGGDVIDSRTVMISEPVDLSGAYWQLTGGSDGFGLSFNDAGQLVLKIEFTDDSNGIYLLQVEAQRQ